MSTKTTEEKIKDLQSEILRLNQIVAELREEVKDQKEAFELSDDSLHNLRISVSAIKGN